MGASRAWLGPVLALVVSVVAGIGIAYVDSRQGWDDTGITAAALAIAALIAVLIEGSGRPVRVAAIAVLVGIWIPILEVAAPGANGPLLAFVFSGVGAFIGWVIVRGLAKPPPEAT
ncbi:MAG TPA: hypothetical protein VE011_07775 [Candidatus Dormibacteraeota bacterium]|nr:hypothetical protein [Candidatus Dormibacteraeota bacterium]